MLSFSTKPTVFIKSQNKLPLPCKLFNVRRRGTSLLLRQAELVLANEPSVFPRVIATKAYGEGTSDIPEVPKRHAFLHDFCVSIPYGVVALVTAVVYYLMGFVELAGVAAVASATVALSSVLSLKSWRNKESSATYTWITAGAAALLTYQSLARLATSSGLAWFFCLLSGLLSGFSAAFCVYNVIAGGNPPRKGTH